MKTTLEALGLKPMIIYESIISTLKPDKTPHAAPIGFTLLDDQTIRLRPYKKTITYKNLKRNMQGVINIVSDAYLFFETTFPKHASEKSYSFEPAVKILTPRLAGADAYIEFEVSSIKEINELCEVYCLPVNTVVGCLRPRAITRAETALLEATIHTTRIKVFVKMGDIQKAKELLQRILYYKALVDRVAPESRYASALDKLVKYSEELLNRY
ncbi:MAG: DUF447 family protein [Aigarchaeota archaeon]|nr:DUF447 family protein [Candidatus Pelearchaeum maunauluense]